MKDKLKVIIQLLLIELFFFGGTMPKSAGLGAVFGMDYKWRYGYMLLIAAVGAAMYIKEFKLFGIAALVCAAGMYACEKRLLIACFPVAILVWILLNVVEPLNMEENSAEKAEKASVIFTAVSLLFFGILVYTIIKNRNVELIRRFFWIPWPPYLIYLCYSLIYKSTFSFSPKAKKFITKIKESLF